MYPTNATTLILGRRLISSDHRLSLFCPTDVHKRLAHTIPADLEIAALGLGISVEEVDTFNNLASVDFLIFPTLDVLHENKRSDFGKMCNDLFRWVEWFIIMAAELLFIESYLILNWSRRACVRQPSWRTKRSWPLFSSTFFLLFLRLYFSPTSGKLPWLKICSPQYFGITIKNN